MKVFLAILGWTLASTATVAADTITVSVKITSGDGTLRAGLFSSQKAFDAEKITDGVATKARNGTVQLTFKNVKPGTYGVTVFHDVNGNRKLDRNLFGAPTEPFGFTRNPKIGFSAPAFNEFNFEFDGTPRTFNITMNGN